MCGQESGVIPYLEKLGFGVVGYGCMTCIGNSGPLPEPVGEAVEKGELVCCGVLSGTDYVLLFSIHKINITNCVCLLSRFWEITQILYEQE